jgi:hypothetical protein
VQAPLDVRASGGIEKHRGGREIARRVFGTKSFSTASIAAVSVLVLSCQQRRLTLTAIMNAADLLSLVSSLAPFRRKNSRPSAFVPMAV